MEGGSVVVRGFVVVFFSSRRRHTRYWRDWISDVCSPDLRFRLPGGGGAGELPEPAGHPSAPAGGRPHPPGLPPPGPRREDWKSVGEGKRGDLGGRRIIKKKQSMQS